MKINLNALILIAMSIVFYTAACNTQSGWQYIMSSLMLAFLLLGLILPFIYLKDIKITKQLPSRLYASKNSKADIFVENLSSKTKSNYNINDIPLESDNGLVDNYKSFTLLENIYRFYQKVTEKESFESNFFLRFLPPFHVLDFSSDFIPNQRGLHRPGKVLLSTSSPFGMFSVSKTFEFDQSVLVYPKVVDVRGGWISRIANRSIVNELSYTYMPTSIPGTTRSLREYVPGDSPRHIHWPTSAKLNSLHVREFEIESSGHITIFLDSSFGYKNREYFELAVITVASLLNICHKTGLRTSLVTQDNSFTGLDYIDDYNWEAQLEVLARVQPISDLQVTNLIDKTHQSLIAKYPNFSPSYVLVSNDFKANESANSSNIVSICVAPDANENSHYTIRSEEDLQYI